MENHKDTEFLEYVIKAIVSNPDKIKIVRKVDEMGVLLTLEVDQEDVSRVIGREGKIAGAIRLLLKSVGYKENARVNLKINSPDIRKDKPKKIQTKFKF